MMLICSVGVTDNRPTDELDNNGSSIPGLDDVDDLRPVRPSTIGAHPIRYGNPVSYRTWKTVVKLL